MVQSFSYGKAKGLVAHRGGEIIKICLLKYDNCQISRTASVIPEQLSQRNEYRNTCMCACVCLCTVRTHRLIFYLLDNAAVILNTAGAVK